jgi:hypothetical protein
MYTSGREERAVKAMSLQEGHGANVPVPQGEHIQ